MRPIEPSLSRGLKKAGHRRDNSGLEEVASR